MIEIKTIIAVIAVGLSIIGYAPYIHDTLKGKTTPHIFTWLIWGLNATIAFALQVSAGAGVGSWITLTVAILNFIVILLGLRIGKKDITKSDTIFLLLSFVAIFLWLIVKQPVLSVILVVTIGMLGFAPTIRKSWNRPHSETLFLYGLNMFRHTLGLFALQQYSIITWLYPAAWTAANGLFSLMLIVRRRQLRK